jgi:hypothetical protein
MEAKSISIALFSRHPSAARTEDRYRKWTLGKGGSQERVEKARIVGAGNFCSRELEICRGEWA